MKYTGTSTRVSCHVYCIKHEDFSCYNYVFYIMTTPYLPCNNNINRKEPYDFYYTAINLDNGIDIAQDECCTKYTGRSSTIALTLLH